MNDKGDSNNRARDEFTFSVDTLRKTYIARADAKRLDALLTIILRWFENPEKAASALFDFTEDFERVLRSEKMEILYPFENVKIANHEFGSQFLEGYFDWNKVSYDPYEQLAIAEKMLDDVEIAKDYIRKSLLELKQMHPSKMDQGSSPSKGED